MKDKEKVYHATAQKQEQYPPVGVSWEGLWPSPLWMEGPAGKRMSSLQVRKVFWRAAESCSGSSYTVKPHDQVCCDCFRCIPNSDELRQRENLLEGYWVILHRWKH